LKEGRDLESKDPRAVKIIEKAVKKIGGRRRLETVKDLKIEAQYATYSDAILYRSPDRVRRDSNFPWGQLQMGFDGERSWHTVESGKIIDDGRKQTPAIQWLLHFVDALLLHRLRGSDAQIKLVGSRTVEMVKKAEVVKHNTELVRITYPDGWVFLLYFDRKTGLPIKFECAHGKEDKRKLVRFLRHYRSHHKIMLPQRIIEINPHNRERTKTRVKYTLNAKVRRREFRAPGPLEKSASSGAKAS
jgi:hypothetical protein